MKNKLKRIWLWTKKEILNKRMLGCFIIAEAIFWSPCIIGVICGVLINEWFFTICVGYIGLWLAPFTPAIPIQLALAYGIKKIYELIKKRK